MDKLDIRSERVDGILHHVSDSIFDTDTENLHELLRRKWGIATKTVESEFDSEGRAGGGTRPGNNSGWAALYNRQVATPRGEVLSIADFLPNRRFNRNGPGEKGVVISLCKMILKKRTN